MADPRLFRTVNRKPDGTGYSGEQIQKSRDSQTIAATVFRSENVDYVETRDPKLFTLTPEPDRRPYFSGQAMRAGASSMKLRMDLTDWAQLLALMALNRKPGIQLALDFDFVEIE